MKIENILGWDAAEIIPACPFQTIKEALASNKEVIVIYWSLPRHPHKMGGEDWTRMGKAGKGWTIIKIPANQLVNYSIGDSF